MAFAAGVNASLEMFAAITTCSTTTGTPSSSSAPTAGSVTTVTLASSSP